MGHDHRTDTGGGQPDPPPGDKDSGAEELVSWIRKSPGCGNRPGSSHRLRIERILYPLLALTMALCAVGIIVSNWESIVLDWRGHSAEARVDWAFQAGSGSRVGVSYEVGRDRHSASLRVDGERIPGPGDSIAVEYDPSDPGRVRTRAPRTALYGLLLILSLATVSGVSTVRTALLRRENGRP